MTAAFLAAMNGVWGLRPQRGPGAEPLALLRDLPANVIGMKWMACLRWRARARPTVAYPKKKRP